MSARLTVDQVRHFVRRASLLLLGSTCVGILEPLLLLVV